MGRSYKEECLRHKYAEIPDENKTPFSTKSRKSHPKSKHKHLYENMVVENDDGYRYLVGICPICGKCTSPVHDDFLKSLEDNDIHLCLYWSVSWKDERKADMWDRLAEHYGRKHVSDFDGLTKFVDLES